MSTARVVGIVPDGPADLAGLRVGDVLLAVNGMPIRDIIEFRVLTDEPEVSLVVDRSGLQFELDLDKAADRRSASRSTRRCSIGCARATTTASSASSTSCRKWHAEEPVREGRRLSALVPLRELHDAHALHRGRPGTGDHRGPVAAVRVDPRDRPAGAQRDVAQQAGRHEPAVAAGAARPRHRGARADRGVPGPQRRRRSSPTRCVDCSTSTRTRRRRVVPLGVSKFNREPRMRRTPSSEADRVVDLVDEWQERFLPTRSAIAWCTPPTSTTCSPASRSPSRPYDGTSPCTRTGSAWPEPSSSSSAARSTDAAIGVQPGFFNSVDGAPPRATGPPGCRAEHTPGSVLLDRPTPPTHRSASSPGAYGKPPCCAPLIAELGRDDVRIDRGRESRFFGGNVGVAGLMVGEDVARTLVGQPPRSPLSASGRLSVRRPVPRRPHTRRPPPHPSTSSPPTASRCERRLALAMTAASRRNDPDSVGNGHLELPTVVAIVGRPERRQVDVD
jgi:hypothetical protein